MEKESQQDQLQSRQEIKEEDLKKLLIEQRYQNIRVLGEGSFGKVILSHDKIKDREVAIKFELKQQDERSQVVKESAIYKICKGGIGIPKIYSIGEIQNYRYMVMELLGSTLDSMFNFCGKKFSLKTVLMLAEQMICRIEFLHSKSYLHRDIKPENFLLGRKDKSWIVYIADLGLCKKYKSFKSNEHIPFKENKSLVGTARYVSLNTHLGIEQSRRDDLESIGYLMIYFLKGTLPWSGIQAQTKKEKYYKIGEKKGTIPLELLCSDLPQQILEYMQYCRSLRFEDLPNYDLLRYKI